MSTPPARNSGSSAANAEEPTFLQQVFRFAVVGALGFVADVGGFNLLRFAGGEGPLHDYPLSAKVVSGILATVVAWVGNRYWTFQHSRREKAHQEFLLFALVAGLGTLIAMGCLWFSHYVLRLTSPLADNISANVIGLGLAIIFRFWAYRRHVFSGHGDGSGLSEVTEHRARGSQTSFDAGTDGPGEHQRTAESHSEQGNRLQQ
jgi:putative flippase GtrA